MDTATACQLAVIVVVPVPALVANPRLLMTATLMLDELQLTTAVTSCVLPSLKVPVAVNGCDLPSGIEGFGGLTEIETRVAFVTVRVVEVTTEPRMAVIGDVPGPMPVAWPAVPEELLIAATPALEEFQVTSVVRSCVLPSVKVPVAVNCSIVPGAIEGFAGLIEIDTRVALVTVRIEEPETEPEVAVIVAALAVKPVARPLLLIWATVVGDALQTADVWMLWMLPSLNVPVAVNRCVVPAAIVGFAGATEIETRVAGVTVSVVEAVMDSNVAAIVVTPLPVAVATPRLLMVATLGLEELQLTSLVRFRMVPSLKTPVAVNAFTPPSGILGIAGVIASETKVAFVTVRVVEPVTEPEVAVMVVVPGAIAEARPACGVMVATFGSEDAQLTELRRCVLPLLKEPKAVNCCVVISGMEGIAGETSTALRDTDDTVRVVEPLTDSKVAVIVVFPKLKPVARPLVLMVATAVADELQTADAVMSWVVPSVNVPLAVNCSSRPFGMTPSVGVTESETRTAFVTVRVVAPVMEPEVAVMVAVPGILLVARPLLSTVATLVSDELQTTDVVMSWVLPLVKVPVAENCWVVLAAIEGLAGLTAIERTTGGVTVKVAEPVTEPEVAEMVVMPGVLLEARPLLPMVATFGADELQTTEGVRSWLLPSVKVPVAENCWVLPAGMEALAGATVMETSVAAVTVRVTEPMTEPDAAEMVVAPGVLPEARPLVLMAATLGADELQLTDAVMACVLPSVKVPVAVNCWVLPAGMEALAGATVMETSVPAVTARVAEPMTEADAAEMVVAPGVLPEARPLVLMAATLGANELQDTEAVRSWVLPSLNLPVAVNCCVVPAAIEGFAGVTEIDINCNCACPEEAPPPQPASAIETSPMNASSPSLTTVVLLRLAF